MFQLLLILFLLITHANCEFIEIIGLSSLFDPDSIETSSEFLSLYNINKYDYDIELNNFKEFEQDILNLTWVDNYETNPKISLDITSPKYQFGIKLLTTAFLKRFIDSHKSTGEFQNNLNLYIYNLEDNTDIDFFNTIDTIENSTEINVNNYPSQSLNIIARNKLGLFLRYNIPDRNDIKLGGISYSDLRYAIGEICDSFSYEDYKLNNVGYNSNKNIVNYLFLSPLGTAFDIEGDVRLYENYDEMYRSPIGIEHLLSLAINNKLKLTREDIINSFINTSKNTIINYLISEEGSVNYNLRKSKSFKFAYKEGAKYVESQASFISIGDSLINYPDVTFTDYKNSKWILFEKISDLSLEEKFFYDVKNICYDNGIKDNLFLPFGIFYEDCSYSVFEYANNMKESFYYLIKYIKSINLSIIDLLKFISLFDNLIETYDLSEIAINHLKELYNDIYYYYDIKYKNLINSIEYENNISNIVSIKDLSNNDELYNYYLNNNIDAINDQDNEDNQNDEENNTENPDIQSAIYDGKNEKNSTETEYFNLNNEENNIIEVDIFEKINELKRIEEENPINTYYYFNNNLYEEEQLLLELKLINKLNKILGKRNIPITDGNITNYLNSLLENIEKIKGYKYATMDDLMVIVNYLKSILINKRLSIINGENKAYNIEELFNAYKDLYNLVSNKIDINDYYTTSKLASLYLDFDLYEELNNSNYNDTLHLNSNIGIDNNKDFIMNYSYQSDKFIHKFITFLLNNYYYEKNYNISVITSELSKKLKSYKNEKIFSENLDNLTHFKEYENLLNRYVSYMDAYNKILTNIFEKKGKILFNGIHYDENLNKYLEIMYKYYQSLIYSDILESNIYSSDCSESFLGIKYYNCTKLLTNKEDTLKEIDLFDIISVGLNLNTYIVEKYKYWFSKYLMNIKPLRRNNNYIQYAYKLFSDEQLKDNLLDTIENALINFYSELTNKILNIKTIIINDNSSLKNNLNYIGEIITININKNINNVIDHNTTEKKALIDYISIVEPIYNYIKEFSSPFNFENIKGIIESI
ncbi:hypothetical protein LY90DRAFT_519496 [Neocallimastix californiae]|uniref:Uncharacterized protein n=1 Tax=Neocallimastix californiae TaxID=1754190 RepID=A0A1Y1Z0U0_9FUNG|nr:hypothetical protein LY90DRAFT_519496 [Neocallimastix californiae]|eukprot:ORY03910.1 hypothetical protein LY90DRAFT_519496 [Neocallimastix californiae]